MKLETHRALSELLKWMRKNDARLSYTTDDDGVHAIFPNDPDEIVIGYDADDLAELLSLPPL